MKKPALLVAAVVALSIAGGAIMLISHRNDKPGQDAASGAGPAGGGGDKPAATPTGGAGEPSAPPEVRLTNEVDPKGTLRLEGQVVDADEKPVGGVTVAISTVPPRFATTEGDGSFTFDGLIARSFSVSGRKGGDVAPAVTVALTAKSEPVILRLVPGITLPVRVIGTGGRPVGGATVTVEGIAPITQKTGADGTAKLAGLDPGWQSLAVTADGYAPAQQLAQVTPDPAEVTIAMVSGARVAGRVVDPSGKPVAGAVVAVEDTAAIFTSGTGGTATSDAQGKWTIAALGAGTYRFRATKEPWAPGISLAARVDGVHAHEGVEIRLEEGARIAGKVVDAKGAPVAAAAVRLADADADPWRGTRQVFADDQGAFSVGGLARRPYELVAQHETGSSETVKIDLGAKAEATDVVLRLTLNGVIEGLVVGADGAPVPEAQVTALADIEGSNVYSEMRLRGLPEDVADGGGAFRLTGLAPGTYRLRGQRPGAPDEEKWSLKGVTAKTGDTGVKIVLPGTGKVKGTIALADGSAVDTFTVGIDYMTPRPFTAAKGKFELEAPAGHHNLSIAGPGFVKKLHPVDIPADKTLDAGTITVEKGRSVAGRVLTPDGRPVEGAKVWAGRQLFGDGSTVMIEAMASQMGVRSTTTDADGGFVIAGVGDKGLVLAAEHATLGRTKTVSIAKGVDAPTVELVLQPFASLSGKVVRGGKPVAYAIIMVIAQAAAQGSMMVKSGPDGAFRLDHLTPDTYLVSSVVGAGVAGGSLVTKKVTLGESGTAEVILDLPGGGVNVRVVVTVHGGVKDASSVVALFSGTVTASTSAQAIEAFAQRGDGSTFQGLATAAAPAKFSNVMPGGYTLCSVYLGDMNDPAAMQALSENDDLPFRCNPATIAATPPEQTLTLTIEAPPAAPPTPPPTK